MDPIPIEVLINHFDYDSIVQIYLSCPELRDQIDQPVYLAVLTNRFGISHRESFLEPRVSINDLKKELYGTYTSLDDGSSDWDERDLVMKNVYKSYSNKVQRTFVDHRPCNRYDYSELIYNLRSNEREERLGPNYVWWYFGYIDTLSPYWRASIGEIPLTPDLFESLLGPGNKAQGEIAFQALRNNYNSELSNSTIIYNSSNMGHYSLPSRIGWTKSQLKQAIVDSGVNLNWSLVTGNQEDNKKLPGFRKSSIKLIFYQELYRRIFSTASRKPSWSKINQYKLLNQTEMRLLTGNLNVSYSCACDILSDDNKVSLEKLSQKSHSEWVEVILDFGYRNGFDEYSINYIREIKKYNILASYIGTYLKFTDEARYFLKDSWLICSMEKENIGAPDLVKLIMRAAEKTSFDYLRQYLIYLSYNYPNRIRDFKLLFAKMNILYQRFDYFVDESIQTLLSKAQLSSWENNEALEELEYF